MLKNDEKWCKKEKKVMKNDESVILLIAIPLVCTVMSSSWFSYAMHSGTPSFWIHPRTSLSPSG